MTPYRIRSRSVSVRRRRGPEFVVVSLPKPLSLLLRNYSRNFKRQSAFIRETARFSSRAPLRQALVFNRFNPNSLRNFPLPRNTEPPRSRTSYLILCPALSYRSRNPQAVSYTSLTG